MGRIKSYTQHFASTPDEQAEQLAEVIKVYARHGINYEKLRWGSPEEKTVENTKKREMAEVAADMWVVENAVARGLSVKQLLRNLIFLEIGKGERKK